jgi:hypothetical protein
MTDPRDALPIMPSEEWEAKRLAEIDERFWEALSALRENAVFRQLTSGARPETPKP